MQLKHALLCAKKGHRNLWHVVHIRFLFQKPSVQGLSSSGNGAPRMLRIAALTHHVVFDFLNKSLKRLMQGDACETCSEFGAIKRMIKWVVKIFIAAQRVRQS